MNSKQEHFISNQPVVRILVVDDFAPWRSFVISKLGEKRNLRVIEIVSDGLAAVERAERLQPDLILLDIGLPKLDGIAAARRIRKLSPQSKILFVSQDLDLDMAREAIEAGGHGYVVKSDAERELLAAVEAVMKGERFVSRRFAGHDFDGAREMNAPVGVQGAGEAATHPVRRGEEKGIAYRHEIQLYADEGFFLESFARFLGSALKAGDAAILVATPAHRAGLLQRLQVQGTDFAEAIKTGRFTTLDTADLLSSFMVNDMPDRERFLKVTGHFLSGAAKKATGTYPRVAACGECAPLLWVDGKPEAAIRVEQLWNEIASDYNVEILCGYPWASFRRAGDTEVLRRIRAEHSAVHSW